MILKEVSDWLFICVPGFHAGKVRWCRIVNVQPLQSIVSETAAAKLTARLITMRLDQEAGSEGARLE